MAANSIEKCANGPSNLFPDTIQCANKPVTFVFGGKYCKECSDYLVKLHAEFSKIKR